MRRYYLQLTMQSIQKGGRVPNGAGSRAPSVQNITVMLPANLPATLKIDSRPK